MLATTNPDDGMVPIPDRLKRLLQVDWNAYRETAARYEAAWSDSGEPPVLDDFLPAPDRRPLRALLLIHLIKEEYERRHDRDSTVAMAEYFDRFPELRDDKLAIAELRLWADRISGSAMQNTVAALPPSLPEGYRFLKELARGGMSRLFLIEDAHGVRKVLKQIDATRRDNAADILRFENEIRLARDLSAKGVGIVPASLVHEVDTQLAYMMPYCAGGSLRDRLMARRGQPLEPPDAARLVVALARTVQRLQEEQPPIVHRDLKPENVLFATEHSDWGEPLIADLGLAKVVGQEGLTRSDAALGTWVYMAPEQVRGAKRVNGRVDVYALGVILYECLTSRRPFSGETPVEIIHRIYNETAVEPSKRVATVPAALDEVVRKCLQKDPAHRYATARELAEDLDRFRSGVPVQARPPGRTAKLRSWAGRHRTEALAYAAALGALILGLIVSTGSAIVAIQKAREAESQARSVRREAQRADDNAGLINGALGRLVERLGRDPRLKAAGLTAFRNALLHDAVAMYDELARRNPGQGTLGLGEALNNQTLLQYLLGEIPQAIDSARRAEATLAALPPSYEARTALAKARQQMGVLDFAAGHPAEGMKKTEEAVALYQTLAKEKPSDPDVRFQLVLATTNLGNFVMVSQPDVGVARYGEALALLASLRKDDPAHPRYTEWEARTKSNLGLILAETGKTEAAIATQREAVAAAEQISDEFLRLDALAACRNNLAEALEHAQHPAEAEPVFRQSLRDYQTLASRFPDDIDYRWGRAMVLTNIAAVVVQDRPKEALGLIEEAGKLFEDLSRTLGSDAEFQQHRVKHAHVHEAVRKQLESKGP